MNFITRHKLSAFKESRASLPHLAKALTVAAAAGLATPALSQAGVWIQTSLAFTEVREEQSTSSGETASGRLHYTGTAGWAFAQGFMLGAQGLWAKESFTGDYSWAIGPKGGLLLKGFELTAAYLPMAKNFKNSTGSVDSGGGFAINAGYTWRLPGPFRAGVQATYWSMILSERNGQDLPAKPRVTYLSPQISLAFQF